MLHRLMMANSKGYHVRFNPMKQATWRQLTIESATLDGADDERCLVCLQTATKPKKLKCFHKTCFKEWDRCPACRYN